MVARGTGLKGDTLLFMKATHWEFTKRALVFGLIFAVPFQLYLLDHQNSAAAFASWLGDKLRMNAEFVARLLFAFAALVMAAAALIRTWASAYLHANVVYAAEVKTESLVADGPYRWVRNPLYFANVLLAIGAGALMSRTGFFVAIAAMLLFCYRLILREEFELQASRGEQYERYRKAVPRLWPSLRPGIPSAGSRARWSEGFKAEFWCWGFPVAFVAFASSLSLKLYLVILAASTLLLWLSSVVLHRKSSLRA